MVIELFTEDATENEDGLLLMITCDVGICKNDETAGDAFATGVDLLAIGRVSIGVEVGTSLLAPVCL